MSAQDTSAEPEPDLQLEIAHLLLIDVVGYSRLLVNEQIELLQELNQIVRNTGRFRAAEAQGKLIRLPTGDGMALLFFQSPEEPAHCALEISQALQSHPHIQLRMGVHSGPVNQITDVNDRSNIAGSGINVAQRILDCGDAGHIILSKHLADDLAEYRHWQPYLHDLGECEVKHGLRLHVVNLYKDGLGNPALPEKLRRGRRWKQGGASIRPVPQPYWPKFALVGAVLLSALALASSFLIFFRRASPTTLPGWSEATISAPRIPEKSIAVLPFQNLSDEKENMYFTDGMQDEILTNLSKVADLKVISRTSVMQYRSNATRNLRDVAKELGVAHVLEGTVQRAGDRVRVSAQLIDARTDTHLWAEHYDRPLHDVFAIQSEVAQAIADQLRAKLSPAEKAAIEERPTADLAAYDLYVRAKVLRANTSFDQRATENLLKAVRLLDQAIARDPVFFLAYCQLAEAHDLIYFLGSDHTPARLALADTALKKALDLRPDSGEAHLASAEHLYRGYRDHERALAELIQARRKLPNDPLILELTGFINRRQGHWQESTMNLNRALELDPRNFFRLQQQALTYQAQRRYREMAAVLDRALNLVPSDANTRVFRAAIALDERADPKPLHATIDAIVTEDPEVARGIADQWLNLALCERDSSAATRALAVVPSEGISVGSTWLPRSWCEALAARFRGDPAAARAAFATARAELEKTMRGQPDYAQGLTVLGMVDAGLGHKEDAIREGRRAVELLPVSKDALDGPDLLVNLALIYVWTGEKDLALKQLVAATQIPSQALSYGQLRLQPYWDPLRSDSRFEKIVASLAPK